MGAATNVAFFPETESNGGYPAGIPGVDESGLRRLPEAPEPELALSDLPDLSELLVPARKAALARAAREPSWPVTLTS